MESKKRTALYAAFGEPTQAKASGLAFSLATILSPVLAIALMIIFTLTGITANADYVNEDWYRYVNFLLPQIAFAITVFVFFKYTATPVRQTLQRQKCTPKYFAIALLLQIGLFALSELNTLFIDFITRYGYKVNDITLPSLDGFGFVLVLLVVALIPAVIEETFFRGVLLGGVKVFGKTGAVLVCGALFSLYHQNPAQTLYQFCCGAAYALVALRAGSILPTVTAHFFNNALIVTLQKCGVTAFPTPVLITVIIVSAVCLVSALLWLFLFDKKPETDEAESLDKTQRKTFFKYASAGIAICAITWIATLFIGG